MLECSHHKPKEGKVRALTMLLVAVIWVTTGCGGGAKPAAVFVGSASGKLVSDDVAGVASATDVAILSPGTVLAARTQESGLAVYERSLKISAPELWQGGTIYALQAVKGQQFGPGDSGAPIIVGPVGDKKVGLAIFAGYDSGNLYGRGLDEMLLMADEDAGRRSPSAQLAANSAKRWPVPFFVTSPLEEGRYATGDWKVKPKFLGNRSASRGGGNEPPLIGGSRYAAMLLDGDTTQIYWVASLTVKVPPNRGGSDDVWLATGHSVLGLGRVEIPVRQAWVDSRILGEYGGWVIAHPYSLDSDGFGTLTYDGPFGSVIHTDHSAAVTKLRTEVKV
ncbi:MAG: hypothetical protein AAB499_02550, partial [Patescibacteria group bacterium]